MVIEKDQSGKFAKGNRGGPGRPKKEREEKYYDILASTCTPADWIEICEKAVTQAKKGDPVARKWIADYLIGPPVQKNEHSGPDGGPLKIRVTLKDNEDGDTDGEDG